MNKFTKSILALGLALSIIIGVGGVSIFAAERSNSRSGMLNGYGINATSTISYSNASAYTSYGSYGSVSVNSKYTCIRISTLDVITMTQQNGHYKSTYVSFTAPSRCRSIYLSSTHEVASNGNKWTGTTYVEAF